MTLPASDTSNQINDQCKPAFTINSAKQQYKPRITSRGQPSVLCLFHRKTTPLLKLVFHQYAHSHNSGAHQQQNKDGDVKRIIHRMMFTS